MLADAIAPPHCPASPPACSRTGVLYGVFSAGCLFAALLLLSQLFNYPAGLKVGPAGSMGVHALQRWAGAAAAGDAVTIASLPLRAQTMTVLSLLLFALFFVLVAALTVALKVGSDG